MKRILVAFLILVALSGCTTLSTTVTDVPNENWLLFEAVVRFHYARELEQKRPIAMLSVGGKRPPAVFMRRVNAGGPVHFIPDGDYRTARRMGLCWAFGVSTVVEREGDEYYVYASEGTIGGMYLTYRFVLRIENGVVTAVRGENYVLGP